MPGQINIFAKITMNYKEINGYTNKGTITKVRDLTKELILVGRVINLEKLLDL